MDRTRVSRVLVDMRVMPFIHGMYGIVILRGAAVTLMDLTDLVFSDAIALCHGLDTCLKMIVHHRMIW